MTRHRLGATILVAAVWAAPGCEEDIKLPPPPGLAKQDGISGKVTHGDGVTPVPGASVVATPQAGGQDYATTSGSDGTFAIVPVADGTYDVVATKSSFAAEKPARVSDGKSTPVVLRLTLEREKLAVVPGDWDNIGAILSRLGYHFVTLHDTDLADASALDGVELLFLNCGSNLFDPTTGEITSPEDPQVLDNLRAFVERGGYLYASDWEALYVANAWPGAINFLEPDPFVGDIQNIDADLVDVSLAEYLGKSTAEIGFDLPQWVVMDSVPSTTQVLVRGSVSAGSAQRANIPLMVYFHEGQGTVAYTSFHNEAQVTGDVRKILFYFIVLSQET